MPRTTQAQAQEETANPTADQVAVNGIVAETIEPPPAEFDQARLQSMVARSVAEAMVPAMQAILPELLKSQAPQFVNGPTQVTHVQMVENAPVKPTYLKHYRMDGVLSGKYQLLDVSKLDENGEIVYDYAMGPDGRWRGDAPAVVKGKWVHFQNEHFYATTPQEVAFVEWKIANDPQFRAYEDKNTGGHLTCGVANCGRSFPDEETLAAHRRATHGV